MDDFLYESVSVLEKTNFNTDRIIKIIEDTRLLGGVIYTCGNGGSSATASHFTSDLVNKGYRSLCLSDNIPLLTSIANDFTYDEIFSLQLKSYNVSRRDLVILISCSGKSENILQAFTTAKYYLCPTIIFTAFSGNEIFMYADYLVYTPTNNIYLAEGLHSLLLHDIVDSLK
jgi:D-sedoheptulose 7-phosphate isomerase